MINFCVVSALESASLLLGLSGLGQTGTPMQIEPCKHACTFSNKQKAPALTHEVSYRDFIIFYSICMS